MQQLMSSVHVTGILEIGFHFVHFPKDIIGSNKPKDGDRVDDDHAGHGDDFVPLIGSYEEEELSQDEGDEESQQGSESADRVREDDVEPQVRLVPRLSTIGHPFCLKVLSCMLHYDSLSIEELFGPLGAGNQSVTGLQSLPLAQVQGGLVQDVIEVRAVQVTGQQEEGGEPGDTDMLSRPRDIVIQLRLHQAEGHKGGEVGHDQGSKKDELEAIIERGLQTVHLFSNVDRVAAARVDRLIVREARRLSQAGDQVLDHAHVQLASVPLVTLQQVGKVHQDVDDEWIADAEDARDSVIQVDVVDALDLAPGADPEDAAVGEGDVDPAETAIGG